MLKAGLLAASTSASAGEWTGQCPKTGLRLVDAVTGDQSTDSHLDTDIDVRVTSPTLFFLSGRLVQLQPSKPSMGNVAKAPCSPCLMLTRGISCDLFPEREVAVALALQSEHRQCHEMSAYREGEGASSKERGTMSGCQVGQVSASVTD